MDNPDPLSRLLREWKPSNPQSAGAFTAETMRRLRRERGEPLWVSFTRRLTDFLDEWLPEPRILVPGAVLALILMSVVHWTEADETAKGMAAMRWQRELAQPMSALSLAGAYAQTKESFP